MAPDNGDPIIRVLGPLEVQVAGTVRRPGRLEATLLALLASDAGRVVSTDRLVDGLWEDDPPASARNRVQALVSGLRRTLGPAGEAIATRPPGYELTDPRLVDVNEFERLVGEGRRLARQGEPSAAVMRWTRALGLWRGDAYDGVSANAVLAEATRLAELRRAVIEESVELRLALGQHAELVPELARLVTADPLRERLRGQLMVALHRAGRQAEALEVYRQGAAVLAEAHGLDPGDDLRRVHRAVLANESPPGPATDPAPQSPTPSGGLEPAASAPGQLPADVAAFTGREVQLEQLDAVLTHSAPPATAVVIWAVTGTAGIGKTALAVHWAHRVRGHFPDGQLYVNLRGYASTSPLRPIDVLSQFLQALGVAADQVPVELDAAAGLFRSLLADRRMFILLDNARSPEQVRPLLPGTAGCLVLVTSRDDLSGLVARDGARRVLVDVLPEAESEDLLRQLIGVRRARAEPDAIAELAHLCGHLPLALRIAGANLSGRPHLTVSAYTTLLREGNRLSALALDGDDKSAVRTAFDLSYTSLTGPAQRLFRLLGLVPGPDFTPSTAAALTDAPVAQAVELLGQLARAHLVEEHAPGRYTFHDLLRLYAAERASTEDPWTERDAGRRRLFGHYQQAVGEAADLLYTALLRLSPTPGPPSHFRTPLEASGWLDAERSNLLAAIAHTAERGPRPVAYGLADGLRGYFYLRMRAVDWLTAASIGLDAARAEGDLRGEAAAELSLATLYGRLGRADDSIAHMRNALELSRDCGWVESEATLVGNLGAMCAERGLHSEAIEHTTRALAILRTTDASSLRQYIYVGNLGAFYAELGDLARSEEYHDSAITLAGNLAGFIGLPGSLYSSYAQTAYLRGDLRRASDLLDRALALHRECASPAGEAEALWLLACVRLETGALAEAAALARDAVPLARDSGRHRVEAHALAVLGRVHQALGESDRAGEYLAAGLRVSVDWGLLYLEAVVRVASAARHVDRGELSSATAEADAALDLARAHGYRIIEGQALAIHAAVALAAGRGDRAVDLATRAVTIHRETGHRLGEAHALVIAGRARQTSNGLAAAGPAWRAALAIFDEAGATAPRDVRALPQSALPQAVPA